MENERKQTSCPKCGKDNPDDARFCNACGFALSNTAEEEIHVRISALAIASFVCALCGLVLLTPSLAAVHLPRVLSPRLGWIFLTFLAGVIILAASLVLGLVSLIRIELGGGKITGRPYAVGAVLLTVFGGLLPVWSIIIHRPRSLAFRMICGANLSGIGKAMSIYANDYDDEYPRAGGKTTACATKIPDWKAANRFSAYSLNADGTGGKASISSSLYLLVKVADLEPKRFVCLQEPGTTEFEPAMKLVDMWDFGPEPWKHCSYSYYNPYGQYALTTSCDPGLAVAADRNPWMDSPFARAGDFSKFDPDGDRKALEVGNAFAHKTDGQNVLFVDCHVNFEKVPFCGVNDDNIYTYWNGQDIRRGSPPQLGSQPADRLDSLLVNDPAVPR